MRDDNIRKPQAAEQQPRGARGARSSGSRRRSSSFASAGLRSSLPIFIGDFATVLEKKKEEAGPRAVSFIKLFQFATCVEWLAIWTAIVLALIMGLCIPLGVILYGEFTALLVDRTADKGTSTATLLLQMFGGGRIMTDPTPSEQYDALIEDSIAFFYGTSVVSLVQMIAGLIGVDLLNYAAIRQVSRIRELMLRAMLRQEMAWYDTGSSGNFASKMSEDLEKMKEGMGEKIAMFVYLVMSFFSSIIISFFYGWKLTLVVISSAPVIIAATAVVAWIQSNLTTQELQAYGKAGSVAEEVISSIRTVVAFGGEKKEINRYAKKLEPALETGKKKGLYSGLGAGIMWLIVYLSYGVSFYYGVSLIMDDRGMPNPEYTPAVLIIVFFGVLAGAQNLGLTAPQIEAFGTACGSAANVFNIISRESAIDGLSDLGLVPDKISGNITFEDVYFNYPARPSVKVLSGFNLTIRDGQTVALVGSSGCGKSTALQLLQRLYDPAGGRVLLGGTDLRELRVGWLRANIGVVGQEPVLFMGTIADNIRFGKPDATMDEVLKAAQDANCHEFISKLPKGYDTLVGERGAQMSGGQKQRIAIARALVRQPAILLLDEATSALDLRSQAKVQAALDNATKGRTTLVVSHRLSTIVNADLIVYLDKGRVVEMGTHLELMKIQGKYYSLVQADILPPIITETKYEEEIPLPIPDTESKASGSLSTSIASSMSSSSTSTSSSEESQAGRTGFMRVLKLNTPELGIIIVGCVASLLLGATLPAFAFVFGDIYGILSLPDRDEVMYLCMLYSIAFLVIGLVTGVGVLVQMYVFSLSGSKLTTRLRQKTFAAMLRQEMGWYDDEKNTAGALGSRLAGDCSAVQGATGIRVGTVLQAFSTLVLGMLMGFVYSWKMTLVSAAVVPIILGIVFWEARMMGETAITERNAVESAARVATEAVSNVRTVAGLGQEKAVLSRFQKELDVVSKAAQKKSRLRGLVFSLGQTIPFFGYAISLSYGGVLIAQKDIEYKDVIKVSEALIFGSWMLGQALAFAPNFNSAMVSAGRIFGIWDREPKVDTSPTAKHVPDWHAKGKINYSKIEFKYPTRPGIPVLQGLTLEILAGKTVALVGHSGCGKSTCIQLIQRLYDPLTGSVSLDDKNIEEGISIPDLRAQLGIVSQEPVLFDRTIAENIAYGVNDREVSMTEVMAAAVSANIHDFISTLPLGYETSLGLKGTQLSGGQKQRIAIARALVRNPRVLLLDEATSALDTQSEKVVQEALDRAGTGRTCIIIAHRLSTIHNADIICVVAQGVIAESGTHDQLLKANGLYAQLYSLQEH